MLTQIYVPIWHHNKPKVKVGLPEPRTLLFFNSQLNLTIIVVVYMIPRAANLWKLTSVTICYNSVTFPKIPAFSCDNYGKIAENLSILSQNSEKFLYSSPHFLNKILKFRSVQLINGAVVACKIFWQSNCSNLDKSKIFPLYMNCMWKIISKIGLNITIWNDYVPSSL